MCAWVDLLFVKHVIEIIIDKTAIKAQMLALPIFLQFSCKSTTFDVNGNIRIWICTIIHIYVYTYIYLSAFNAYMNITV